MDTTDVPMEATPYRWSDLDEDAPMERIRRRRIIGHNMMISEMRLSRGFHIDPHTHDNEQMACVLSGRIRFELPAHKGNAARTVELGAGDVLAIPGGVPHGAEALEDTVILDVFSPPSERTGVDGGG